MSVNVSSFIPIGQCRKIDSRYTSGRSPHNKQTHDRLQEHRGGGATSQADKVKVHFTDWWGLG